jgi:hypothetical protein
MLSGAKAQAEASPARKGKKDGDHAAPITPRSGRAKAANPEWRTNGTISGGNDSDMRTI